ncbi:MAG TPA: tRNA (adenosine(37)-N6)-threonylcarbamoyltransferase complex dimerization subunit type 1 TsaB [Patescibacteria group bacterium]|nr:tRNA (adenosine(37)-N6)-threonylcarbamoyltransferase complex dimerization subunit type 1 TsaB [Patescibacteria group bacterium]
MKILFLDTTNNTEVILKLFIDGKEHQQTIPLQPRQSHLLLSIINDFLEKHSVGLSDLTEIQVGEGPGSFTGVRVGLSVANALAFGLEIPVNKTKIIDGKTLVEPRYS